MSIGQNGKMHIIQTHTDIITLHNPRMKSRFIYKTWHEISDLILQVIQSPEIQWEENTMTNKGMKKRM